MSADADYERGTDLAALYARLHDALIEHVDAEEQQVMPLVEVCITAKEWQRIGKAAQRGGPAQGRTATAGHARL